MGACRECRRLFYVRYFRIESSKSCGTTFNAGVFFMFDIFESKVRNPVERLFTSFSVKILLRFCYPLESNIDT